MYEVLCCFKALSRQPSSSPVSHCWQYQTPSHGGREPYEGGGIERGPRSPTVVAFAFAAADDDGDGGQGLR